LREDETTLTDEEKNELVNSVWCSCENPYCKFTRFLDVHHIVDEKDGGTNKMDNLIVLCSFCHDLAHRNEIPEKEMRGWIATRGERFQFKPNWHYH
jgi:5-methylcytosine-specific restriction endonuclease McrA